MLLQGGEPKDDDVLTNAIYFKGKWQNGADPRDAASTVRVRRHTRSTCDDNVSATRLPPLDDIERAECVPRRRTVMVVVLPARKDDTRIGRKEVDGRNCCRSGWPRSRIAPR